MNFRNILCTALTAVLLITGCASESESFSVSENSEPAVSKTKTAASVTASSAEDSISKEDSGLYDYKAISEAYLSGDTSGLDSMQRDILNAAEDILAEAVSEDMTLIEKELAVHDKLAELIHYDDNSLSVLGIQSKNAADPYGGLIYHNVICTGYALTFALMMEMLGIETIVVEGTNRAGSAHAWDMVRLDGEWYCVDLTWDDLDPEHGQIYVKHQYFNSTSDSFYEHDHRWERQDYPEAASNEMSYAAHFCESADSLEAASRIIENAIASGRGDICIIPEGEIFFDLSARHYDRDDIFYDIMELIYDRRLFTYNYEAVQTDKGWALMVTFKDE